VTGPRSIDRSPAPDAATIGGNENADRRRNLRGVPPPQVARGRALAYQLAMAICLVLAGMCLGGVGWGLSVYGVKGPTLLILAIFPGLFPGGFLCLMLYGYWSDYRSEQARGILGPRFQFNLSHLLLLVFVAAILFALVVYPLRSWMIG
jgi:hypothetical protein